MSERRIERALARLAKPGAVLAVCRDGGFAVYTQGDRRRRPSARLNATEVRALQSDGSIALGHGDAFELTAAGASRVRRGAAEANEAYVAQHGEIIDRPVIDAAGDIRALRGFDGDAVMRRLAGMRGQSDRLWLEAAELAAASRLRRDWLAAQIGLLRGSDWRAAPIGTGARGASNAQEIAMARRCDARRRVAEALDRLAPALRRVVEGVCLHEDGVEALERAEGWPARSGKLALKLGLAQLAAEL